MPGDACLAVQPGAGRAGGQPAQRACRAAANDPAGRCGGLRQQGRRASLSLSSLFARSSSLPPPPPLPPPSPIPSALAIGRFPRSPTPTPSRPLPGLSRWTSRPLPSSVLCPFPPLSTSPAGRLNPLKPPNVPPCDSPPSTSSLHLVAPPIPLRLCSFVHRAPVQSARNDSPCACGGLSLARVVEQNPLPALHPFAARLVCFFGPVLFSALLPSATWPSCLR